MSLAIVYWYGSDIQYLYLAFICTTFFSVSVQLQITVKM